jgi:hypothetical protein
MEGKGHLGYYQHPRRRPPQFNTCIDCAASLQHRQPSASTQKLMTDTLSLEMS